MRVLQRLGTERALVVYGRDGLDEISLGAATLVAELRGGQIREYEIHPEDFGLAMASSRNLRVENAEESKRMLVTAFGAGSGVAHDIVALNAGAALYVSGQARSIAEGLEKAVAAMHSGAAATRMAQFVETTRLLAAH